jgi:hypothetical protein
LSSHTNQDRVEIRLMISVLLYGHLLELWSDHASDAQPRIRKEKSMWTVARKHAASDTNHINALQKRPSWTRRSRSIATDLAVTAPVKDPQGDTFTSGSAMSMD